MGAWRKEIDEGINKHKGPCEGPNQEAMSVISFEEKTTGYDEKIQKIFDRDERRYRLLEANGLMTEERKTVEFWRLLKELREAQI